MSMHANIRYKIEKLFETDDAKNSDVINKFVEILQSNQAESSRNVRRYFLWLVIVWAISLGIRYGIITEGDVSSFKITDVSIVIAVSPVIISCLYYLLTLSYAGDLYLSVAIAEFYKRILPTAHLHQLHFLLSFPTFFNIERYFTDNISVNLTSKLDTVWAMLMVTIVFVLPLGALAQATYLMIKLSNILWFILWPSLLLSILFVIKGILNIILVLKVTRQISLF